MAVVVAPSPTPPDWYLLAAPKARLAHTAALSQRPCLRQPTYLCAGLQQLCGDDVEPASRAQPNGKRNVANHVALHILHTLFFITGCAVSRSFVDGR